MAKNNKQPVIADNFEQYTIIGETDKYMTETTIIVSERVNHRGIDCGSTPLISFVSNDLRLEIEQSQTDGQSFKFKIYDSSLIQSPCYRFDSDGEAHLNPPGTPLSLRQISTPHFHKFNEAGIEYAYKTDDWIKNQDKLLSDFSLAFESFAREENIKYKKVPDICQSEGLTFLPDNTTLDPLKGEHFDE